MYAVFDRDLERMVAIKVLDRRWASDALEVDAFLAEARASARIDHAAVVPVFDVRRSDVPWFVMRRIVGSTIAEALSGYPRPAGLQRPRAVAMTMLRVSEAVAAAHRLGIVHCDLKPDNLLLGEHGEVWVADWGLSGSAETTSIRGTPAYMSPEQSRGGVATAGWDVYALGVILHELLYDAPPLSINHADWWHRRSIGERDAPSVEIQRLVPPALRAIVDCALEVDPHRRYASADQLTEDLRAFLADEPVSALHEGWFDVIARRFRRHRAIIATAGPLILLAGILGWLLAGERIRTYARWGSPVATADNPGWIDLSGGFVQQQGAVVSTGPFLNQRALRRSCQGGIAVAYEASFAPDQSEGDISIAFAAGLRPNAAEASLIDPIYALVCTWENTGARIRLADLTTVDAAPIRFQPGSWYAVRIELDQGRLTIAIDGRAVCAADVGGWDVPRHVVLYGVGPGKRWRNLRIWQRGLPERLPATAIGDAFMRATPSLPRQAAEHYRSAIEILSGREADDARLRLGVALTSAGDAAGALQVWNCITDVALAERAWTLGTRMFLAERRPDVALSSWRHLADRQTPAAQLAWSALMRAERQLPDAMLPVLRATGERMPRSYLVRETLGEQAILAQRWDEAIPLLAGIQPHLSSALLAAGRAREVIDDPLAPVSMHIAALIHCGRLDDALAVRPLVPSAHASALIAAGRAAEVIDAPWADLPLRAMAALALGDDVRAARDGSDIGGVRSRALRRLGRLDERLREQPYDSDALLEAGRIKDVAALRPQGVLRHRLAVVCAALAGQIPPAVGPPNLDNTASTVLCEVVVPSLRAGAGDDQAVHRLYETARDAAGLLKRRAAPLARAVRGAADEALPDGDRFLAAALRAELAGEPEARRHAWSAWLALPPFRRDPEDCPALLVLARSRAAH